MTEVPSQTNQLSMGCFNYVKFGFTMANGGTAFTCSKLTIETLKQGVKYVQS